MQSFEISRNDEYYRTVSINILPSFPVSSCRVPVMCATATDDDCQAGRKYPGPLCRERETQVLKVINSGAICAICLPLSYPVLLTNHPHSQNTFSPPKEPLYQWSVNPCDFFSQSLATMTLYSVYVNLPILNNSYKNNHMIIFCFCFGCFALYTHTGTHT